MSFEPNLCRNESEVESKLIVQYLLPTLGYTPDTWSQEVTIGSVRLDFLARIFSRQSERIKKTHLVIEAKHPKENLDRHTYKLRRYLDAVVAEYGLLTNGQEIRIYQWEKGAAILRLVFQCRGEDVEEKIGEIKDFISRKQLLGQSKEEKEITKEEVEEQRKTFEADGQQKLVVIDRKKEGKIEENNMKTLAIYHHKGGVGKTTVSVNLAAAFRRQRKRVLLIDMDAQANATFATGLIKFKSEEEDNLKDKNAFHLLENSRINFIPDLILRSNQFNRPEIDVIPSHISLIERQHKLVASSSSSSRLQKKLTRVTEQYDIVIIDTPPSLDIYAQAALIAADYLIIPSDLKPFSNQGLNSVKNFIDQEIDDSKENLGMSSLKILGVLPSKISTNHQYLKYSFPQQKEVIIKKYNLPLMENMISERIALSQCINQTTPAGNKGLEIPNPESIFNYADNVDAASISADEFQALAMEVLEKMEG